MDNIKGNRKMGREEQRRKKLEEKCVHHTDDNRIIDNPCFRCDGYIKCCTNCQSKKDYERWMEVRQRFNKDGI